MFSVARGKVVHGLAWRQAVSKLCRVGRLGRAPGRMRTWARDQGFDSVSPVRLPGSTMLLFSNALLFLVGCPADSAPTPVAVPEAPVAQAPPVLEPGPPPTQGGNSGNPPPNISLDLSTMKASNPQAQVLAGPHIKLTGTFVGTCAGNIAVHAIPATPAGPGGGPYTILDAKGTKFSLALGKSTAVFLIPHCDADNNGIIDMSTGDSIGSRVDVPASNTDITGLVLDLTTGPTGAPPTGMPGEGNPAGAAVPGGPGAPGGSPAPAAPGAGGAPPMAGPPPPGGAAHQAPLPQ